MNHLESLIESVEEARSNFIRDASNLSPIQAEFKPSSLEWSVRDIVEHMVWAERAGVTRIWKALHSHRSGQASWEGTNRNQGLGIEKVINQTWKEKEQVPEIAKPSWGGPIELWLAALNACSLTLRDLGNALAGMDLEAIVYPHPISGPLDADQRIQFLRFHLDRHRAQIERVKLNPEFPQRQ